MVHIEKWRVAVLEISYRIAIQVYPIFVDEGCHHVIAVEIPV